MAITKRQRQVYDFIAEFVQRNQYSPSFEEIGEGLGLSSLATVHKHISNLENKGLLNVETLGKCKDGVVIVNTARGGLIDEPALLAAVESGKVAAAGLDSFQQEPPPADHPFFRDTRFVLSPHIGGVTSDAFVNMGVAAATNALAVLNESR